MNRRARAVERLSTIERDHRGPGGAHRLDWFERVVTESRQHFLDKPIDQRPPWVERYGIPTSVSVPPESDDSRGSEEDRT